MPGPTYVQEGNMVRVTTPEGSHLVPSSYVDPTKVMPAVEPPPPPDVWAQDAAASAPPTPAPQPPMAAPVMQSAPASPLMRAGIAASQPASPAPPERAPDEISRINPDGSVSRGVAMPTTSHTGDLLPQQNQAGQRYTGELATAPGNGAPQGPRPGGGYVSRVVPASWQEAGGVRKILSPEVEAGYDQLYLDREGGARDAFDRGVQRAQEESAYIGELQADIERKNASLAELRQQQDRDKAKAIEDISKTADDIANERIDPMVNRDAKARITTGIMMGMGSLGAMLTGGPNIGMQIVQDEINRSIDAQKTNYEIRRKGLADKASVYGMMKERFGSQLEAENASKAALYEQAELKAKQWAAARGIDAQNAQYNDFMNQLSAAKLEHLNQINGVIEARYVPAHREVLGGGAVAPKPKSEDRGLMIPGYGVANTKEDAGKGKEAVQTMEEINAITSEIEKLTAGVGDRLDPAKRARAASLVTQLDLKTKNMAQLGALSESDAAMVAKLRGDPQAIIDWGGRAEGLKALREMTADGVRKFMHSRGVTGAQQYVREGPKGREVSVELTGDQSRTVAPKADAPVVRKPGDKARPEQMPRVGAPPPPYTPPNQNARGGR